MYIGIFAGVVFGFILPNNSGNEVAEYTSMKCSFAVFDYDNSEDSRAFTAYMEDLHTLVSIADDTKETMQDELFIRNVDCIIRIKKGVRRRTGFGRCIVLSGSCCDSGKK